MEMSPTSVTGAECFLGTKPVKEVALSNMDRWKDGRWP